MEEGTSVDMAPLPQEKELHESLDPSAKDTLERKRDEDEPWSSRSAAASTRPSRIELTRTRGSSKSPLELHRRCAETIERCCASLRERQRKMERLQLVLPLPSSGHRREDRSRTTPPTRSTPPRPAKRNKIGFTAVVDREKHSPDMRSPAWSLSSSGSKLSTRLRFDEMTTSPMVNRSSNKQEKVRIPFQVGTPNTPQPARQTKQNENETTATQESTPASRSEDTLELSSTDESSRSSHKKATILSPTWSQRQQDFMAAIEAEVGDDDTTPS
ncbi:hypothetical protein PHYPSEUDO_009563 [Phytophthora pseudosyringae]|uniref:Uncharacterized protein n=1 Tax=Phytophthora pseudosyringae TaxID=221518 RepID=A0A8T1WNR2_9STRA|nr:hypothetical protein PHYPSEUDO_009563 [Phytophthora pseudosyringae]